MFWVWLQSFFRVESTDQKSENMKFFGLFVEAQPESPEVLQGALSEFWLASWNSCEGVFAVYMDNCGENPSVVRLANGFWLLTFKSSSPKAGHNSWCDGEYLVYSKPHSKLTTSREPRTGHMTQLVGFRGGSCTTCP